MLKDKTALGVLKKMVIAQGGNGELIDSPSLFKTAAYSHEVLADKDGYIAKVDTEGYGIASLLLGAGRNKKEDKIDYSAGIVINKKTGDAVKKGEVIATLYANNKDLFVESEKKFLQSTVIGREKPILRPLILGKVE